MLADANRKWGRTIESVMVVEIDIDADSTYVVQIRSECRYLQYCHVAFGIGPATSIVTVNNERRQPKSTVIPFKEETNDERTI